jgi:zinc D-Ala-D-Ala carboxypeptidase
MKLTANISLDELIKSQVAERKGINNNPSPMQIENLKALAINILQPIRSEFRQATYYFFGISYSSELCIEIGSKITSEHCADNKSAAADFEIPGIDNKELAQWIRDNLIWNQLILEFYKEGEPSSAAGSIVQLFIGLK